MSEIFGTDGIRGVPWNHPFTEDFLEKIGYAVSLVISRSPLCPKEGRSVLIGADTRGTCARIKECLAAGMAANGFEIVDLGVITTPAVSYLVKREKANFGVMISASHNPPEFNGIKFFSAEGTKLSDSAQERIEKMLDGGLSFRRKPFAFIKRNYAADYLSFVEKSADADFSGERIMLDCANGAAYEMAPKVFSDMGAETQVMGNEPDGRNINLDCGALFPGRMAERTKSGGFFCGISLDGDGDRCIFADEEGEILDGDDLIAIAAPYLKEKGKLRNGKVVLTFMSNCGLLKFLESEGIGVERVPVGDKNVTDALDRHGLSLGGESSGHIIFHDFGPTGDGILTSAMILKMVRESGKPMSWHRKRWKRFPNRLVAHRVGEKVPFEKIRGFREKLREVEARLGSAGRIFIRYSGTEPVLRLLVEGEDENSINSIADEIIEYYEKHGGEFDGESKIGS